HFPTVLRVFRRFLPTDLAPTVTARCRELLVLLWRARSSRRLRSPARSKARGDTRSRAAPRRKVCPRRSLFRGRKISKPLRRVTPSIGNVRTRLRGELERLCPEARRVTQTPA